MSDATCNLRLGWSPKRNKTWVVVSNISYFHPYLGKMSNLTSIFKGVETTNYGDIWSHFHRQALEMQPSNSNPFNRLTLVHIWVWNHEPRAKIVHLGLDRNLGACAVGCPSPCSVADFPCDLDLRRLSAGTKGSVAPAEARQQRPVAGHAPLGAALPAREVSRQRPGGVSGAGGGRQA